MLQYHHYQCQLGYQPLGVVDWASVELTAETCAFYNNNLYRIGYCIIIPEMAAVFLASSIIIHL